MEREPIPIRHRAWRQVALPIAGVQLVVNAAFAWVLFHDYSTHAGGAKLLTRSVALADVFVLVTIVSVVFGSVTATWGSTDTLLGRVTADDPAAQQATVKSPIGWQGILYIAVLAVVLSKVVAFLLPASPTLLEVAVARGLFASVLAFVASGAGYVRGAVNARAHLPSSQEARP